MSAFEVLVERAQRKSRSERIGPPKVVRFLAMAEEFQRLLEGGEVRSRAELARRNDLQRARVTQLMDLLELHPMVRDFIRSLDGRTPERGGHRAQVESADVAASGSARVGGEKATSRVCRL